MRGNKINSSGHILCSRLAFFRRARVLVRGLLGAVRIVNHLLTGVVLSVILRVTRGRLWYTRDSGQRVVRWWTARLNRILGLRAGLVGDATPGPVLLVLNHISWLDIVALLAVLPVSFVSKASVRQWPVIGYLAAASGTVFLERGRNAAIQGALESLTRSLGEGRRIAIFPEGTTTVGEGVETFRPALLEAAIRAGCPIQPVAVRYRRDGRRDELAPFVGDDGLVPHLWRLLGAGETQVEFHFLAPLPAGQRERGELAELAQAQIAAVVAKETKIRGLEKVLVADTRLSHEAVNLGTG